MSVAGYWVIMVRSIARGTLLVLVALALAACAVPGATPPGPAGPLEPLIIGWEQFFKVDWVATEQNGRPAIAGHVFNDWGLGARRVRLLVDELDARGAIVWQTVSWLGFDLPAGTRAPFIIAVPHGTPNYRVRVFSFDWVTEPSHDRLRL
jgi:hypothetical protein